MSEYDFRGRNMQTCTGGFCECNPVKVQKLKFAILLLESRRVLIIPLQGLEPAGGEPRMSVTRG